MTSKKTKFVEKSLKKIDDHEVKQTKFTPSQGGPKSFDDFVKTQAMKKQAGADPNPEDLELIKFQTEKEELVGKYLKKMIALQKKSLVPNSNDFFKYKYYESLAGSDHPYDISVTLAETQLAYKDFENTRNSVLLDSTMKKEYEAGIPALP